jgi:hypothetical protein
MPHRRRYCGVALFGDKVLIVGGRQDTESSSALRNVVMYDITKNECQELAPLPYHVCEMATVKWDDDNVMILRIQVDRLMRIVVALVLTVVR